MDLDTFRAQYRLEVGKIVGLDMVMSSHGNAGAKIVHIGQAPSLSGIKSNTPWDDKSGQRLRNKWYLLSDEDFYNKDNFYMTAMGMYFPGKDKNGGDAKPSLELACKWLPIELALLKPHLIILIGKMAADFFFPKADFKVLIFNDQEIAGVKTFVLPHPSPVNVKWYKDNPSFEESRVLAIRNEIHRVLKEN